MWSLSLKLWSTLPRYVLSNVVERTFQMKLLVVPARCALGAGQNCSRLLENRIGYSCALRVGWYSRRAYLWRHLTESFPRPEEKRLILDDGPAECRAVLIAVKRILLGTRLVCEEVGSIQRIVAEEFENRTMELIRPAFGHNTDLAACSSPEFRSRNAGLNSKLLHRVGDPEVTQYGIDLSIYVAHAIEQERIRLRSRARNVEAATLCSSR